MRGPDTDDYNNMSSLMKYIQVTIVPPLILSINNPGNIKWYIDAAFAVQNSTMIHIGGFVTMGTGGYYVQSSKLKLNTKSST